MIWYLSFSQRKVETKNMDTQPPSEILSRKSEVVLEMSFGLMRKRILELETIVLNLQNENRKFMLEVKGSKNESKIETEIIRSKEDSPTEKGKEKCERIIIENNVDTGIISRSNLETNFMIAVENGQSRLFYKLLYGPAIDNPNMRDGKEGWTPLMRASIQDRKKFVSTLLREGADPDMKTLSLEKSALGESCNLGHLDVVGMLLGSAADPNIQDVLGTTPLMEASKHGHPEVVRELIKYKANPNIQDKRRETALFCASRTNRCEIVKILLESGADPNLSNQHGQTALIIAQERDNTSIVETLMKKMEEWKNRWNA